MRKRRASTDPLKAAGTMWEVYSTLYHAVEDLGGDPSKALKRILAEPVLARRVAALLIEPNELAALAIPMEVDFRKMVPELISEIGFSVESAKVTEYQASWIFGYHAGDGRGLKERPIPHIAKLVTPTHPLTGKAMQEKIGRMGLSSAGTSALLTFVAFYGDKLTGHVAALHARRADEEQEYFLCADLDEKRLYERSITDHVPTENFRLLTAQFLSE